MSDDASNVLPFARPRSLTARGALAYLAKIAESHPDSVVEADSVAHLGTLLGWERSRTSKQLKTWQASGKVTVDRTSTGKLVIRILPSRDDLERADTPSQVTRARRPAGTRAKRAVKRANSAKAADGSNTYDTQQNSMGTQNMLETTSKNAPANVPHGMPQGTPQTMPSARENAHAMQIAPHNQHTGWRVMERHEAAPMSSMDVLIVLVIIALTGVPAMLSINGMQGLFGGTPWEAFGLGVALESAKLGTSAWMSLKWHYLSWGHRLALMGFIAGIACINAISVYSQLVASHLSIAGEEQVAYQRSEAEANGKLSLAETRVNDFNRRISQIDATIEGAAAKGRSDKAINAKKSQQQERAQLVVQRDRAQQELADLKTSRSTGSAKHQATVNEALPIQYVAEILGIHKGGEEVIRWLIAGIVLCADPFALVLAHAFGAIRRRRPA